MAYNRLDQKLWSLEEIPSNPKQKYSGCDILGEESDFASLRSISGVERASMPRSVLDDENLTEDLGTENERDSEVE